MEPPTGDLGHADRDRFAHLSRHADEAALDRDGVVAPLVSVAFMYSSEAPFGRTTRHRTTVAGFLIWQYRPEPEPKAAGGVTETKES